MANMHQFVESFGPLGEADFQARVSAILTALPGHVLLPQPWPDELPSLAQLQQEDADYRAAHRAVLRRDYGELHLRDAARGRLSSSLMQVAAYLEAIAGEDFECLRSTGFIVHGVPHNGTPARATAATPSDAQLSQPQRVQLGLGPSRAMAFRLIIG
ncbi:MAG: hypothetical protein RIQ60_3993 [Pseudomonadota bacterium]